MRGDDRHPDAMFSYVAPEQRVPADHPLRAIRTMVDTALRDLSPEFARLYPKTGRPLIPRRPAWPGGTRFSRDHGGRARRMRGTGVVRRWRGRQAGVQDYAAGRRNDDAGHRLRGSG